MVLSRQMIVEADTIEMPLPTLWRSTTGWVVAILYLLLDSVLPFRHSCRIEFSPLSIRTTAVLTSAVPLQYLPQGRHIRLVPATSGTPQLSDCLSALE